MIPTAFVFPGQGSQSIGMLKELAGHYPLVEQTFQEVSECIGYDVWALVQEGPLERLNQTEHTQVAMLTADVAVYRVLQHIVPMTASMMAGHSLGEYAALVCSNALSLTDAATLVAKRGQLMQQTVAPGKGAMAAIIGLSDEDVQLICEKASTGHESQVTPANYNAIGQVVIAGHTEAVEKAIEIAETSGARMAKIIPVSVPCHCSLLEETGILFREQLQAIEINIPDIPVISNVDLSIYQSAQDIRHLLQQQLHQPVRWVETIQEMQKKGIELIIECGPGKVLSGLVKRIDKSIKAASIHDEASLRKAVAFFE